MIRMVKERPLYTSSNTHQLIFNKLSTLNTLSGLFVFVLLIDPTDNILRLKFPCFALLLIYCLLFYHNNLWNKSFSVILILYGLMFATSVMGILCRYPTDMDFALFLYRSFVPLFLLPWCVYLRLLNKLILPGILIGIIVTVCYIIASNDPVAMESMAIYCLDNLKGIFTIGHRTFLSVDIISVYYSTAGILFIIFPILCYRYMKYRSMKILLVSLLLLIVFIASGLRAIMMSGLAIMLFSWLIYLWECRYKRIASILIFMGIFCGGIVAYLLLNDAGEPSLDVKNVLAKAFWHHICDNPETLLWGNGVGATFDSLGVRGTEATQSELFYYEIIRYFGIPLGMTFLMIYLYPMLLIYRNRKELSYWKYICVGFIFYLFAAGTNPYLISSNGMLTLLLMYSYALNPYYRNENTNCNSFV